MAVTALEIQTRSLVLDGRPFGEAGAYEKRAGAQWDLFHAGLGSA